MLTALGIRDVVLIEALDLEPARGLTALTGETGAGKSIVLDALGLALGARSDANLVRRGASQAAVTATFDLALEHPANAWLEARGLLGDPGDALILRRLVTADGRSRAFVNDQPASATVLRELGAMLLEIHGQHQTVGLLDSRTHRGLLDAYGEHRDPLAVVGDAWRRLCAARTDLEARRGGAERLAAERDELTIRLAELDRLAPREGEEEELVGRRALLGGAEKSLADVAEARKLIGGDQFSNRLAQALRALERARDRVVQAGAGANETTLARITFAADALDRTLNEALETLAAIDAAAATFEHEPASLEQAEERLFALRALARKLGVPVERLAATRTRFAETLREAESSADSLAQAESLARQAQADYSAAAGVLSQARRETALRLARAMRGELAPLKMERAEFRVLVEPLAPDRAGLHGADRVEFQIATNGSSFASLGEIASGGELARLSLALKAALASRAEGDGGASPMLIFDEVDQGVGGAVADAVGVRLKGLAARAQVIVITHSPQVAARADAHWRVQKQAVGDAAPITSVAVLDAGERREELARMLAGREITDAARAAARALMEA